MLKLTLKELLRDLTDNEINEFFNGNPDIVSNMTEMDPKYLDVAPYNDNYELSISDIDFGTYLAFLHLVALFIFVFV